jgi:hypothetical protein
MARIDTFHSLENAIKKLRWVRVSRIFRQSYSPSITLDSREKICTLPLQFTDLVAALSGLRVKDVRRFFQITGSKENIHQESKCPGGRDRFKQNLARLASAPCED